MENGSIAKIDFRYLNQINEIILKARVANYNRFQDSAYIKKLLELTDDEITHLELFGYFISNILVAFIACLVDDVELKIVELNVLPEYQRRGIGSILLSYAISYFTNTSHVYLRTVQTQQAINFYTKHNFTRKGLLQFEIHTDLFAPDVRTGF
jgi:ribosomal protein S18 acetylase RimI-like enzyme